MRIEIFPEQKWRAAWEKSEEALRDGQIKYEQSLQYMLVKMMNFARWENVDEVRICADFGEHCFGFGIIRKDGTMSLNGGIIFHGLPDEGYKTNGSVEISPEYGWATHT